jgi:hypothetical protein
MKALSVISERRPSANSSLGPEAILEYKGVESNASEIAVDPVEGLFTGLSGDFQL